MMVECPNCRSQTELGKGKCAACSVSLNVTDDAQTNVVMLNMGERYTPLIECPNCDKLVRVGVHRCPECYEEIPEPYALASAVTVVTHTIACDTAASILSMDAFAIIAVVLSGVFYFTGVFVFESPIFNILILFWPLPSLIMIALWFYRFGNLGLGDSEYVAAKRRLKASFLMWMIILVVQCLAAVAVYKSN